MAGLNRPGILLIYCHDRRKNVGWRVWHQNCVGQKTFILTKRTGEVAENKRSALKNEPERTEKRSGEVVENTYLWKKRTENEPENEPGHVIENTGIQNSGLQQSAISATDSSPSHSLATQPDYPSTWHVGIESMVEDILTPPP